MNGTGNSNDYDMGIATEHYLLLVGGMDEALSHPPLTIDNPPRLRPWMMIMMMMSVIIVKRIFKFKETTEQITTQIQ